MRGRVHVEPLRRRHLVGADDRPHLVVEDLGRGPGERPEAEVAQTREVGVEIEAERRRPLPDLERREGVDVHPGHRILDQTHDPRVVVPREGRMDSALEADLGRASLPRLADAPDDLVVGHEYAGPRRFAASFPFENAQKPQRK